jgi:tetratricopeptide (TPR) repeat protein
MAHVPAQSLVDAAHELTRGGRWAQARTLLDAVETGTDAAGAVEAGALDAGALAVARAEVEVDHAFWMRRAADPAVLDTAAQAAADDAQRWAVRFARLRAAYAEQLRALVAGQPLSGVDELAASAAELAAVAPSGPARAYATFYRGLIADLLLGDTATGARHFRDAAGTSDEYVRSYALRHLGGVADDAGRRDEALAHWRESTRLRQRAGFVPGALAQLQLYPADTTAAQIVADWAEALDVQALVSEATEPEVARDPA